MSGSNEKTEVAKREEEILKFWKDNQIFEKSLKKDAPNGEFVFYDGPPFATGLPHYGHILAGTIKDVIPRYKTMRGYRVPRRWGWDCHGLPLENQIEKELGLETKRDIETIGVKKFNEAARDAVLRYAEDWKKIIPRFGRWVDMENDYRSMDSTYTESVWWAFKRLHDKGLLYEGYKAMQLCPRCGTTLSNFEVAQGYKDIADISVTVKLPLVGEENTSLLAWTTTPWTLPGNMAAAVNPSEKYVYVQIKEEKYILAKERLSFITGEYEVIKEISGSELVGKSYLPPFDYFSGHPHKHMENAWKVYGADFVTMEDGTGIVHIAPAFGADDLALAQKENIPVVHHVDKEGHFIPEVTDFAGTRAKPKEDHQAGDVEVIKYLAAKGLLFAKLKINHSYPHCWRCDTPLLNYATSSWFVSVPKFKDKLVAENKKVKWVPEEIGQNRFGNWLENARDWAISRSRYWGAPIPVWEERESKQQYVIGSLEELKAKTKKSGNEYFVMRHGEAESNVQGILNSTNKTVCHLTEEGKKKVAETVSSLKDIELIFVSPLVRTKETAEIVRSTLGLSEDFVIEDTRLAEFNHGIFDGKSITSFHEACPDKLHLFENAVEGGESLNYVRKRIGEFLYELEEKYQNKKILIISHGDPAWLLHAVSRGADAKEALAFANEVYLQPGEVSKLPFSPLPHNDIYELDYHRPYIDDIHLVDENGKRLHRVSDVFDCWFESGSMAYAQNHYPFENKDIFDPETGFFKKAKGYPADFIAEGLDQTRGWFYSLLVLGVALFDRAPFKHVIVNGIILAEDGQKMSKKLKNYPDPVETAERYGADAVRYYVIASPLVRSQDLSFSEKGVAEIASKLIGRFTNTLSFYEMYTTGAEASAESGHVLDRWILARLQQTALLVEEGIEGYELDKAARPLMDFVDDLSTWYLRRSRDRLKEEKESVLAEGTLRFVLQEFSKLAAPFIPFTAEYVFRQVRSEQEVESVHLASWIHHKKPDTALIAQMEKTKKFASEGLMFRQKVDIKVRQPLAELTITEELPEELKQLIADEVNVKKISVGAEMKLETELTPELIKEGDDRELARAVAEARKEMNLSPKDSVDVVMNETGEYKAVLSTGEVRFSIHVHAS